MANTLTFTINNWKPLSARAGMMAATTDYTLAVTPTGGAVVVDSSDNVTVTSTVATPLTIAVQAPTPGDPVYTALAIFFKGTGLVDPRGALGFGAYSRTAGSSSLQITDNGPLGNQASTAYNFYIVVQNVSTGDIGIIDPLITNVD